MAETPSVYEVEVSQVKNEGDPKGPVYNLNFSKYRVQVVFQRESGTSTQPHWHTGLDTSYDPQVLFLVSGEMEMHFWDLNGNERTEHFNSGTIVSIPKNILHSYHAVTDISFIEWRTFPFDPRFADTYRVENAEKWRNQHGKN